MTKFISVPISQEAMTRLDFDSCVLGDLIEIVLNNDEYAFLLQSGIFDELNNDLDVLIDDFEDEKITGLNSLAIASGTIDKYMDYFPNIEILKKFKALIQVAQQKRTGVFFYF